jgi:hypothetical protein
MSKDIKMSENYGKLQVSVAREEFGNECRHSK